MTDTPDHPCAHADRVREARNHRSLAAAALVEGDTSIKTLSDYRRWLTVSRLLGDIDEAEAQDSLGRAQAIFTANVSRAVMKLPPHLEPDTRS